MTVSILPRPFAELAPLAPDTMPDPLDLTLRPLTPGRWKDLETLFASRGCAIPRGCWCIFYRETGKTVAPPGRTIAEDRKAKLKALCNIGPPPGLIAYAGRQPVGWVTLGPRTDFQRLQRSPIMKPVDELPVWSIVCFVVPPAHRHQGVAHALLRGAVDYAAKRGARILEAYPVDRDKRGSDDWMWHGAKSMFDKAGFTEVARRKPQRPVMRIELCAASGR